MQASLKITDNISAPLAAAIARVKTPDIAEAVGAEVVSIGQRAFNDPGLRPAQWPAKKGGGAATLKISGALWHSLRIIQTTNKAVTVGSDRPYAAIHQLGGKTRPRVIVPTTKRAIFWPGARHPVKSVNHPGSTIPPRPYFPITATNALTNYAQRNIGEILAAKLKRLLQRPG